MTTNVGKNMTTNVGIKMTTNLGINMSANLETFEKICGSWNFRPKVDNPETLVIWKKTPIVKKWTFEKNRWSFEFPAKS